MSPDEVLVTVVSAVFGPFFWLVWWYRLKGVAPMGRGRGAHAIALTAAACAVLIFLVLKLGASHDVRDAPVYLLMYVLLGLAWLRVVELGLAYGGLSVRDDVIERRNAAALPATAGALVGAACCYAGGNIGDGPGWWVVVFSAALATGTLALAWLVLDGLTGAGETITIDRDAAAGLRLGGWFVASGIVLGRAVAGDWTSVDVTVADYARFLPAIAALVLVAVLVEQVARPTPARPKAPPVPFGMLPALMYLAIAGAVLMLFGWPA